MYRLLGRYQEALADCEAAISGEPAAKAADNARCQLIQLLVFGPDEIRDPDRAMQVAQLIDNPKLLATAHYGLGQFDEARQILSEMVDSGATDPENCMMLALVLAKTNKWQEARRYYHRAFELLKVNRPSAEVLMAQKRDLVEKLIPWARWAPQNMMIVGALDGTDVVLLSQGSVQVRVSHHPVTGKHRRIERRWTLRPSGVQRTTSKG